jgi:phage tail-like protein
MSVQSFIPRTSRFSDVLMNYNFHVFDVSTDSPIVLSLVYGFQHVKVPNISVKMKEIKEGTFEYPHKVMESASCGDLEMSRGAKFFDSDFYDWISGYIRGEPYRARNLLIIQYSQVSATTIGGPNLNLNALGAPVGNALQPLMDLVSRIPARAWLNHTCKPLDYAPAGDLDALSHGISIDNLTCSVKYTEEFNTGV